MPTFILAEKPSVAANIASALGSTTKKNGYYEGNGYFISFAFGHLYELYDAEDYNAEMKNWQLSYYPFIPEKFKYKVKEDEGIKKQLKIIKELIDKSSLIINATDADREGNLIFRLIRDDLKVTKPIKRLWTTSHTPQDIEYAMKNLKDDNDMKSLDQAGFCRQQIDWILGINLTVVYTLKSNSDTTLKLGRVILPTLKLIYDREVSIAQFKSQPFYSLKSEFSINGNSYIGTYHDKEGLSKFAGKEKLLDIALKIKNQDAIIVKKDSKKATENAPKLFNLTDLQGHITNKFTGWTSDKVLKVIQSLYENKYVTYPRTSSRYLDQGEDNIVKAKNSLMAVINIEDINIKDKSQVKFHSNKSVFDSSKVDSHPAISPTYIVPNLEDLKNEEKIVYMEIVKRFVAQFLPAAVYDTVEIITNIQNEYDFITKGKVLIEDGWKQLYTKEKTEDEEENEDKDEATININISINDISKVVSANIKEGKTKPQAHYTEKTLLTAMELCGKKVENEEEILKGFTIGTPATRAETIKKLVDCSYIEIKGKNLLITELGAKVINYFPVKRLLRVDFTGQIEKTLKDIENGTYSSNEFMEKMKKFITINIEEMKNSNMPTIRKPQNIIGKCLNCGRNVIENTRAFSCEGTRDKSCNFTLWKEDKFFAALGKKITQSIAKDLVNKKMASVKGLKSSKENAKVDKYDAIIKMEKNDNGYWSFKMSFDNTKKKKIFKKRSKLQ